MTTINETLQDLVVEFEDYSKELMGCDPSADEFSMHRFIEIQAWGEELHTRAQQLGFTWEQVEDAANA